MKVKWVCKECSSNNLQEDTEAYVCCVCGKTRTDETIYNLDNTKIVTVDEPNVGIKIEKKIIEERKEIEPVPKKGKWKKIACAIFLATLWWYICYSIGIIPPKPTPNTETEMEREPETEMENLIGEHIDSVKVSEYIEKLGKLGIKHEIVYKLGDSMECGMILEQSSSEETYLSDIEKVVFTCNAGTDVSGWYKEKAIKEIESAGWTVECVEEYSEMVAVDDVIWQQMDNSTNYAILCISKGWYGEETEQIEYQIPVNIHTEELNYQISVDTEEIVLRVGEAILLEVTYSGDNLPSIVYCVYGSRESSIKEVETKNTRYLFFPAEEVGTEYLNISLKGSRTEEIAFESIRVTVIE